MTMARYLYSELATAVQARRNCAARTESNGYSDTMAAHHRMWFDKWSEYIDKLSEIMPSGSGFDSGTKLDLDASHAEKLVFTTAFHHMNDCGMYDGWTDHTITVTPSFTGFSLRISGRNRNNIKEYIGDMFHEALSQEITTINV
jgi:hypothetical protein